MINKRKFTLTALIAFVLYVTSFAVAAEDKKGTESVPNSEKLVMIWTSRDKEVATNMVLMYALNAKKFKWWDDITLVIWGPSQNLFLEDKDIQNAVKQIKDNGTVVKACRACAENYGIKDKLTKNGLIVEYIDLTGYIKGGYNVITF